MQLLYRSTVMYQMKNLALPVKVVRAAEAFPGGDEVAIQLLDPSPFQELYILRLNEDTVLQEREYMYGGLQAKCFMH